MYDILNTKISVSAVYENKPAKCTKHHIESESAFRKPLVINFIIKNRTQTNSRSVPGARNGTWYQGKINTEELLTPSLNDLY